MMRNKKRNDLNHCGSAVRRLAVLQILAALLGGITAQAGVVEDYNSKPIITGHSFDSRWQERARMPTDPQVVLGKDWRRTFWAFSPSFSKQLTTTRVESRPPQPAYLSVENLPKGLEGIELRVSWDTEQNLYRCSYHLFISPETPVLPEADRVAGLSVIPHLPPGIGLMQPPSAEKGLKFGDVGMLFSTEQMLSGLTTLESFRRNALGGMSYASFVQGCGSFAHSSAEKKLEVGIVIDPTQKFSGVTRKVRDLTYAVFVVPNSLVRIGAPYFRRASKINNCYLGERRPSEVIAREPTQFREQRERECKQLRTLPIDSSEKPFDIK